MFKLTLCGVNPTPSQLPRFEMPRTRAGIRREISLMNNITRPDFANPSEHRLSHLSVLRKMARDVEDPPVCDPHAFLEEPEVRECAFVFTKKAKMLFELHTAAEDWKRG